MPKASRSSTLYNACDDATASAGQALIVAPGRRDDGTLIVPVIHAFQGHTSFQERAFAPLLFLSSLFAQKIQQGQGTSFAPTRVLATLHTSLRLILNLPAVRPCQC